MSFNHRIDLLQRIDRLEILKEETKRDLRHTSEKTPEYLTYRNRYDNCIYLIGMYKHRLEILEHHIEEQRVGLL